MHSPGPRGAVPAGAGSQEHPPPRAQPRCLCRHLSLHSGGSPCLTPWATASAALSSQPSHTPARRWREGWSPSWALRQAGLSGRLGLLCLQVRAWEAAMLWGQIRHQGSPGSRSVWLQPGSEGKKLSLYSVNPPAPRVQDASELHTVCRGGLRGSWSAAHMATGLLPLSSSQLRPGFTEINPGMLSLLSL